MLDQPSPRIGQYTTHVVSLVTSGVPQVGPDPAAMVRAQPVLELFGAECCAALFDSDKSERTCAQALSQVVNWMLAAESKCRGNVENEFGLHPEIYTELVFRAVIHVLRTGIYIYCRFGL